MYLAKKIIKKDACMKFYDASRPLYLETDALGARLLQVREGMNCWYGEVPENTVLHSIDLTRKSLLSAERHYNNTYGDGLGILHGLDKVHHYFFAKEVFMITEHKPLGTIINQDVAMPSKHLQHITLCIHQYRVCILYKSGPELYIAD